MVRRPLPSFAVALLVGLLAALLATGCGADRSNLIPKSRAADLTQQLADIKSAIDAGQCDGLSTKVKTFHDDATNLDGAVDKRLRTRLRQGANSLTAHATDDCATAAAEQTATTDTEPSTVAPETTTTETQTTTTVPTTSTATTQTTATDTVPTDTTGTTTDSSGGTGDGSGGGTDSGSSTAPDTGGASGEGAATP